MKFWENDGSFPVSSAGVMKDKHNYYYQVQLQMYVHNVDLADFVVYCSGKPEESLIVEVQRNDTVMQEVIEKANKYFYELLLPEIFSRKLDKVDENDRKSYCVCQRPSFGQMISCSDYKCKMKWFHYACVNITRKPKRGWYCPSCKERRVQKSVQHSTS